MGFYYFFQSADGAGLSGAGQAGEGPSDEAQNDLLEATSRDLQQMFEAEAKTGANINSAYAKIVDSALR